MNVYIVTGTSRGLGEALAAELAGPDVRLISISRSAEGGERMKAAAASAGTDLRCYTCDLRNETAIEPLMEDIFAGLVVSDVSALTIIHNAGTVLPIGQTGSVDGAQLADNIGINLTAPIVMTSAFIRLAKPFDVAKRAVFISSGAGKKPYSGWSAYCASKAGIDMFVRCIGQEQGDHRYAVKAVSIAPGVVDTGMQQQIRSSTAEQFPDIGRFTALKENGQLLSAEEAAGRIVQIVREDKFAQGDVIDIRNYPVG